MMLYITLPFSVSVCVTIHTLFVDEERKVTHEFGSCHPVPADRPSLLRPLTPRLLSTADSDQICSPGTKKNSR